MEEHARTHTATPTHINTHPRAMHFVLKVAVTFTFETLDKTKSYSAAKSFGGLFVVQKRAYFSMVMTVRVFTCSRETRRRAHRSQRRRRRRRRTRGLRRSRSRRASEQRGPLICKGV